MNETFFPPFYMRDANGRIVKGLIIFIKIFASFSDFLDLRKLDTFLFYLASVDYKALNSFFDAFKSDFFCLRAPLHRAVTLERLCFFF